MVLLLSQAWEFWGVQMVKGKKCYLKFFIYEHTYNIQSNF